MGIRGEVSTIPDVSQDGVKGQCAPRVTAVLNQLILVDGGHVFAAAATDGQERLVLLAERLSSIERRLNHELRNVWPFDVTVAREKPPAEQILPCDREGELIV